MKKVLSIFAVAAMFVACGPKAAEKAPEALPEVIEEEIVEVTDTTAGDSAVVLETVETVVAK